METFREIKNDSELAKLCEAGEGFIYNDYSGLGNPRDTANILHSASCKRVLNSKTKKKKFLFATIEDAIAWLSEHRGEERKKWKRCWYCRDQERRLSVVSTFAEIMLPAIEKETLPVPKHTITEEVPLGDDEAWEPDARENLNANFVGGNIDTRDLAYQAIRLRRGQTAFRNALISAYGPQCMVTGCRVLDVIEAAHIKPYRGIEDHHVQNGLLLRADIHTLFDLNLIGINPKTLEVAVHQKLKESTYQELAGKRVKLSNGNMPALAELSKRWEEFKVAGD